MSLITILVSLLAERFLGAPGELRHFGWFWRWDERVREWLPTAGPWQGAAAVVAVLAVPFILIALLGAWLADLWGLFGFIFAVLVLLYSFGPQDLEAQVEALIDARERDDEESARLHAADMLGDWVPADTRELTRAVMETIFVETHERILGVIFWFLLLGPAGGLLYRLATLLSARYRNEESEFGAAAWRLHQILAWVPVRLTALAYALSGSFVDAMQYWRDEAAKWRDMNRGILVCAGFGALRYEPAGEDLVATGLEDIRATLSLARRTVVVWLAILGLFTLAGWAA